MGQQGIVTTSLGNAPFVVDGVNGFLLPSSTDVGRAVTVFRTLAADAGLRRSIGQAARSTSLQVSWERMGQQYEQLYLELLAERRPVRSNESALNTRPPVLARAEQSA